MRRDETPPGAGGVLRFGPGPAWYTLAALLAALAAGAVLLAIRWAADPLAVWLAAAFAVLCAAGAAATRTVYELDRTGIRRSSIRGRRSHGWDEMGRIRGRDFQIDVMLTAGDAPLGWSDRVVTTHVLDREGRPLFHVSPWVGRRRELLAAIRAGIRERRREDEVARPA